MRFGQLGQCSDALGPTSARIRAGQTTRVAKPLTGIHQGIRRPLVSDGRFGRCFGSQFRRANPADAGREKALSFLIIIKINQALGPGAHNPLVPGSPSSRRRQTGASQRCRYLLARPPSFSKG
jgi:hypothetical protein